MERWACVDVAAFPLQLLLRAQPAWGRLPVVVVDEDKSQGTVLFVNARAHARGVRAGQQYATALTLAPDLRAGTIPPSQVSEHVRTLADLLRRHAPEVEPSVDVPGVFWLDVQGLARLHPSLEDWARAARLDLQRAGLRAAIAVGFTRFGSYALAKGRRDTVVCADPGDERRQVARVPLAAVDLEPDARRRLETLGIVTVGEFLRLPADGLRQRFGESTASLHRLASGRRWAPLQPVPAETRHEQLIHFDAPERQVDRLLFIVKRLLDALLGAIAGRAHAVAGLVFELTLDDRLRRTEHVRPAAPTLDAGQLLTLVRLRLESCRLSAGIVTLHVTAETCSAPPGERRLFPQHAQRDPELAHQAFARLRAELGEQCVVRARLGDAHLPAAQFEWEPLDRLPVRSTPTIVAARPLVRRIYARPVPLPAGFTPAGSGGASPAAGAVLGPYIVSGGWWGGGVRREYYYTSAVRDRVWWVYYDHRRKGFFLQGHVE